LPLLDDPGHATLTAFLRQCPSLFKRPRAILVISAHWEAPTCTVQSGAAPDLLFDYYGFPQQSYHFQYPAPGHPALAARATGLLQQAGIDVAADAGRGFDHGVFVPLMLMYPEADIPCFQVSLLDNMDPSAHIALGRALAPLREEGVLILGSGSPFHNMQAFRDGDTGTERCRAFDDWLFDTCCNRSPDEAAARLADWESAPHARYAHPREEHLLPLHVCFGSAIGAGGAATRVFDGDMMGYKMSAFLW
jgi:aromatic ring-opening dioxygenase catalytic subunit (LigB family)